MGQLNTGRAVPVLGRALAMLRLFFDDKRYTTAFLILWAFLTCTIFNFLGAFHVDFMRFGPHPKSKFMGTPH